jgi:crotonobetainyl-CoA:carnitine CoA-transferase CaiB-like acyl-CoA transferase
MDPGDDQRCYVRRFRDGRLAMISAELSDAALSHHATLCGATLARAHARSGDAARIAGYMGSGGVFDAAIADFAVAYMVQSERDWRLFLDAIKAGRIEAHTP